MKKQISLFAAGVAAFLLLGQFQLGAQQGGGLPPNRETLTTSLSSEIKPMPVLDAMQRVADWQLANPSAYKPTDWTQGAGYAGMMALAGISGDTKYRDAMIAMGETNEWKPGARKFHADDHCVGQTYTELYLLYRQPKMIEPLKARFD